MNCHGGYSKEDVLGELHCPEMSKLDGDLLM